MATRSLGVLTLDLIAKIGGFEQGLDKATRRSEKFAKDAAASARKIGAATATALTAATGGLVAFLGYEADVIAGYQDMAEKIGDTAEAVASIKRAVDIGGTSFEAITAASVRLTSSLSKTDDESKGVGVAIKALGIDFDAFKKQAPIDQIEGIAEAMASIGDPAKRTALAVQLFGKSGAELLPFLNDLADGAERQITLTEAQIQAADEFAKSIDGLKSDFSTFKTGIAADLIPAIRDVVTWVKETTKGMDDAKASVEGLGVAFKGIVLVGVAVGNIFQTLSRALVGGWFVQVELAKGNFKRAYEEAAAISDAIMGDVKDVQNAYKALFESAGMPAALASPRPRSSGTGDGQGPEPDKPSSGARAAKNEIDEWATSMESARAIQEEVERIQGEQNKLLVEGAAIYERTRTPLERFNAEIQRLNELRDTYVDGKPLIDADTYTRAVSQAQDSLESLGKKTKDTTDEMSVFAEQAARNMQDAFADFLFDPFAQGLDGMVKGFAQTMQRLAAERAAEHLFDKVDWGNVLGSIGAGVSSLFGGFGMSPSGTVTRDSGGPGVPGQAYAIGVRAQPEVFVPKTAGTFIPNADSLGKKVVVHNQFMIQAPTGTVSKATESQIAHAAGRAIAEAVRRNG